MSEAFLTVAEVAARLKCHPHTVRRWIWARKLNAVKVGDMVRVPASEVDRLLRPEAPVKGASAMLLAMEQMQCDPDDVAEMLRLIGEAKRPADYADPLA